MTKSAIPRSLSLSLILALAVSGCSVGPDYQVPDYPVPDAWESAAAADVEGESPAILDWWSAFGDPELDSLMVRARDANLDMRVAVGRVSEARALRAVAGGDYWPQAQAHGQFEWGESPLLSGGPTEIWQTGLGATWELDLFGRVRRGKEAADAQFHASIEDYRDVQVALYAEVATSYVTIRALLARIEFAENNIASQHETMEIVSSREEAGLVPQLDVARARSNLANTRAAIPLLRMSLAAGAEPSLRPARTPARRGSTGAESREQHPGKPGFDDHRVADRSDSSSTGCPRRGATTGRADRPRGRRDR